MAARRENEEQRRSAGFAHYVGQHFNSEATTRHGTEHDSF